MSKTQPQKTENAAPGSDDPALLSAKQDLALRALLSHPTYKEAAKASGISETTLWRYTQDKTFASRLTEMRREAVNHLLARLQNASADAATALHEVMRDKNTPAPARISAALTFTKSREWLCRIRGTGALRSLPASDARSLPRPALHDP